jgi:hypothetical protein
MFYPFKNSNENSVSDVYTIALDSSPTSTNFI